MASSISAWEAEMLVEKGRLELKLSVDDLITHCEGLPFFRFVPMSAKVGAKAARLELFHADPADRIIVAATIQHGAVLITKDDRIRSFSGVETVW